MAPFLFIPGIWGVTAYLIAFFAACGLIVARRLREAGAAEPGLGAFVLMAMSYPMLFMADRGNFEGLILVLMLLVRPAGLLGNAFSGTR